MTIVPRINYHCYFCQKILAESRPNDLSNALWCFDCMTKNHQHGVITAFRNGQLHHVTINVSFRNEIFYVSLFPTADHTTIVEPKSYFFIRIPGLAINPTNATEKLKTYLIFS